MNTPITPMITPMITPTVTSVAYTKGMQSPPPVITSSDKTESISQNNYQTFYATQTSVFHLILAIVAFYLVFKCNNFSENPGTFVGSFLLACCCPYLYIPYMLAKYWSKDGICMPNL
jgi:hypothetical protein